MFCSFLKSFRRLITRSLCVLFAVISLFIDLPLSLDSYFFHQFMRPGSRTRSDISSSVPPVPGPLVFFVFSRLDGSISHVVPASFALSITISLSAPNFTRAQYKLL